jgi:hypothetical protein
MRSRKPTMPGGTPEQSVASARGPERVWTLAETLDGYEIEELTPTQAARLLRKQGSKRSEPGAPEDAPWQSLRNRARGRQSSRPGRSPDRTAESGQGDGEGGASDEKEECVLSDGRPTPGVAMPKPETTRGRLGAFLRDRLRGWRLTSDGVRTPRVLRPDSWLGAFGQQGG